VTTTNNDVSVVMLTKNSARTIEQCLISVLEEHPAEVVAVDGMSTDATPEILRRYGVRVIADQSCSLGRARQIGVEAANGAYIMFVDSDVELTVGCIAKLKAEIERFGWGAIHAKIISRDNSTYWQRAENDFFRMFLNPPGPQARIGLIAAMYRKDLLLEHPFDPNFVESAEDTDVCRRLRRDNYVLGISPTVIAYHTHRSEIYALFKQRFGYGKGTARVALKYDTIPWTVAWAFAKPVFGTMFSVLKGKMYLIPFWFVVGVAEFAGIMSLLSKERRSNAVRTFDRK